MVGFDDLFLRGGGIFRFFGGFFRSAFSGIPVPEMEVHHDAEEKTDDKALSGEESGEEEYAARN